MALVVSHQSNPRPANPTAPLTQALQSFGNVLAEEQKRQYQNSCTRPDTSSVIRFVSQIDANNKGRASRCVAPRLCTFLNATQQFAGVVDTFVSSNPTVAALVWGSIKTTILAVCNITSYFEKVTSMIMNLGRFCPTYQQFGQLYPDCVGLQSALCEYYAIIIRLCIKIVEVSRRTAVTQMLSSVFNPFESEFKSYHDDLDLAAKDVQFQISLASKQADYETARLLALDRKDNTAHWRSALKFHKDALNEYTESQQWRLRKAARESAKMRSNIRANLSSINQVKPWKQAMQQRTPGTADWFQYDVTFRDWKYDKETAVLWVSGTLGVGKTVLVSNIVAYLHKVQQASDIISYFFCQYDHEDSLQARNILGSITRQLLDSQIEHAKDDLLSSLHNNSQDLSAPETIDFLASHFEDSKTYYVILDGLDECESSELRQIARAMDKLSKSRSMDLKILFAGRPELERGLFNTFDPDYKMALARKEVDSDIDQYIATTLEECLEDERLKLGDQALKSEIAEALREGSHGMFLWTHMTMEEICLQLDDNGILEALEHLPRGLSELLDRKLRRVSKGTSARQAIKILQFCGVAKRPLTVEELREVLSVKPSQQSLDRASMPNDMKRVLVDCGGLTFVDEEENTIHYVHHSVKTHLFESKGPHSAEFMEADLDKHLGYLCMTYLEFNDFNHQVVKMKQGSTVPLDPLNIGMSAISHKSGRSSRIARKLLRQSTNAQSMSAGDFERKAQEILGSTHASRLESELSRQGLCFRAYAKEYWIFHLKDIDNTTDEQIWKLFCRFTEGRNIMADRPWTTYRQTRKLGYQLSDVPREIQWCLAKKHNALLLYIATGNHPLTEYVKRIIPDYREIIAAFTSSDAEMLSDVLEASASKGRVERVSILLAGGADVSAPAPSSNWTALQAAARSGHLDVVERLLEAEADVDSFGAAGWTALQMAARGGHLKVVERLLRAGADVNNPPTPDYWNRTALQVAARSGHLEVVESLLGAGADVNAPATGYSSWTALGAAAERGHLDVVKTLLAARADVNAPATEHSGRTALQAAAERGHLKVVEILLRVGAKVNAPATEHSGRTALQAAAERGHLKVVEILLRVGANVNAPAAEHSGRTALHAAAERGHLDVVERLLSAQADANAPAAANSGRTALQAVAERGHLDVVERLLEAGANVNSFGAYGLTPLQAAAEEGHLDVVKRLLEARADVNSFDASGLIPLPTAAGAGHLDVVKRLLEAGVDVNSFDASGLTPLQAAAEGGHLDVVKRLLEARADVNSFDTSCLNPLQAAAEGGHLDVVERLLRAGADVNAPAVDCLGRTALQAAAEGSHLDVVQRLLRAGGDVNAPAAAIYGRTALQAAAGVGHLDLVETLLIATADVNAPTDSHGRTALQAAAEGGHLDVVERLLRAKADINAPAATSYDRTALEAAKKNGHHDVVERLRRAKADVEDDTDYRTDCSSESEWLGGTILDQFLCTTTT